MNHVCKMLDSFIMFEKLLLRWYTSRITIPWNRINQTWLKDAIHDAAYTSTHGIKHFMWINSLDHENESSLLWELLLETSWSHSPDQEEVERAGKGHFLPSWECPNPAENLACRRRKVSSISSERMVFVCMRHFPGPLEVTSSSGPASTTLRGKEACLWQTGKARLIKRCDNTH